MNVTRQRNKLTRLLKKLDDLRTQEILISAQIQNLVRTYPLELCSFYKEFVDERSLEIYNKRINN